MFTASQKSAIRTRLTCAYTFSNVRVCIPPVGLKAHYYHLAIFKLLHTLKNDSSSVLRYFLVR